MPMTKAQIHDELHKFIAKNLVGFLRLQPEMSIFQAVVYLEDTYWENNPEQFSRYNSDDTEQVSPTPPEKPSAF